jgi:hypothetical protein
MALGLSACGGGSGASDDIGDSTNWGGAEGEEAGVIDRDAATGDSTPITALIGVWNHDGQEIEFTKDGDFITRFGDSSHTAAFSHPAGDVRVFISGHGSWNGPWQFDIDGDTLDLTDNLGGVRTYTRGHAPE